MGGLGKPNRGRDRGETFFPDSASDRDETFQISRNLALEHVEFVCLLDSQLCSHLVSSKNHIAVALAAIQPLLLTWLVPKTTAVALAAIQPILLTW